jgi:hypothetical protein
MKKRIAAGMIVVCLAGFYYAMAAPGLKVTVTAVDPPGGGFGNNYEIVMWIKNAAGTFIKTFGLWGHQTNSNDLHIWTSQNGGSKTVDGVSAATLSTGTTVNATWNLTNAAGTVVPDGNYTYNLELSNHHSATSGYSDWYVRGTININGTTSTKTGTDSVVNTGTTYLTAISAAYTPSTSIVFEPVQKQNTADPLAFVAPKNFCDGIMRMKLMAPNGRVVWQKNYRTSAGNSIVVTSKDVLMGSRFSGVGILVADYGVEKISRLFVQTN